MDEASPTQGQRRIVAAIDGSATSRQALVRAAAEALAHDATLEVMYAWKYLDQDHMEAFDPEYGAAEAKAWLERFVSDILPDRPEGTTIVVVNDHAARAITEAGRGAWTVVIGSRGMGGFRGLLLGSVSQQVVQHADSPVLVIPTEPDDD
ncbi:MAG: universal stress protein [Actinomycetota bacterium]|nr:universal stress protein [Actinomycetota bacterium]